MGSVHIARSQEYSELFFFPSCLSVAFKYERSPEEAADERLINEAAADVYFTRNRCVALSRAPLNARFSPLDPCGIIFLLNARVLNAPRQCKIYAAASDSVRAFSLPFSVGSLRSGNYYRAGSGECPSENPRPHQTCLEISLAAQWSAP